MIMNTLFKFKGPILGSVLIKSMIFQQLKSPSRVRIIWFFKRIFSISSNLLAIFVILICATSLLPEKRRAVKHLKLINRTDFKFVINNKVCDKNTSILIMVNSALQNKRNREIIRTSWGSPIMPGIETRLVFMLGSTSDEYLQREIDVENLKTRDIVQGNFLDTYRNLTFKSVMGHLWVSEYCQKADFIVKSDDDIYNDIYGLHEILKSKLKEDENEKKYNEGKFMLGVVNHIYTEIIRNEADSWNKWFVSYDEWPRDESKFPGKVKEFFPSYIVGWLLVVNPATSLRIVKAAEDFPYLYLEDVWLTGLLREKMDIQPIDIVELRADSNDMILVTKTVQNSHHYVQTFITSISFERDNNEYELCYYLEQEARRCYQSRCLDNIYTEHTWLSRRDLDRGRAIMGLRQSDSDLTLGELFFNCAIENQHKILQCRKEFLRRVALLKDKNWF